MTRTCAILHLTLNVKISEHIASCSHSIALHLVVVGRGLDDGLMEGGEQGGREGGWNDICEVSQSPRGLHSYGEGGGADAMEDD